MRLPFATKPKTLTGQAGALAGDAVALARSLPDRLEGGRTRALAVAGGAASAAAGFAFWRARKDDGPSVHADPARTETPWKTPARETSPATDGAEAPTQVAGSRSK